MQDSRSPAALHAALRFVIGSDALSDHKATLIDVLQEALRAEETADINRLAAAQVESEWQEEEIAQMKVSLQDRLAKSWQDADECAVHLAAQLGRGTRSVREKAMELGLGASVDYRLANSVRHARDADA